MRFHLTAPKQDELLGGTPLPDEIPIFGLRTNAKSIDVGRVQGNSVLELDKPDWSGPCMIRDEPNLVLHVEMQTPLRREK